MSIAKNIQSTTLELTPKQAREMALLCFADHRNALWSLADQVEALTTERDEYAKAVDWMAMRHKMKHDALMSAAKLALDALEDCRDVLYQVAHGNQACSDAEGVGSTLPDVFEALKKAGVQ